jgi:hypothetical protein
MLPNNARRPSRQTIARAFLCDSDEEMMPVLAVAAASCRESGNAFTKRGQTRGRVAGNKTRRPWPGGRCGLRRTAKRTGGNGADNESPPFFRCLLFTAR